MTIFDKISSDIKDAMRAKDKDRLSVLRMVLADLKNAKVASSKQDTLDDEESLQVLSSYEKKLKKSLDEFPNGEAKDKIQSEIAIVQEYLPKKAEAAEIIDVIKNMCKDTPSPNFGQIMKLLNNHFKSRADGQTLSRLLKEHLQ